MLRALQYSALVVGVLLAVTFEPSAEAVMKSRRHHKKQTHSKKIHAQKAHKRGAKKHALGARVAPMQKAKVHRMPERQNASMPDASGGAE